MSLRNISTMPTRRVRRAIALTGSGIAVLVGLTLVGRLAGGSAIQAVGTAAQPGTLLVLAVPAFLAGLLSFLSPCCLPILPTYFAFTFQARRERIVRMTVAFFLGLATTMVMLGATASALSQILFAYLREVTLLGGIVIICFGIMSLLGKGFSGFQLLDRPAASVAGSYLYGTAFSLGWTACVGPILGALLTMLATQGGAVLEGAILAFIYALGLGTPLILSASFFSRLGPGSHMWRLMRGRGFSLNLGVTTLHIHTTGIASGVLLIVVGTLLASGQLALFSQWAVQSSLTQRILDLEEQMRLLMIGR
jgi:cytochrome c-type biogenesis protein